MLPKFDHSDSEHTGHRFVVLDAMRGVAALAVVLFHTGVVFGRRTLTHGYLAVDFFFLLSGFVISYAYGGKLDRGMSSWTFFKARFARLYPLYFLGLTLGVPGVFLLDRKSGLPIHLLPSAVRVLSGILLIPLPQPLKWAYPFNFPTWSLAGEVVANLVHALFLRRCSNKTLLVWLALTGASLLTSIRHFGSADFGARGTEIVFVVPRVLFSYTMGILLERSWAHRNQITVPVSIPFILLAAVLGISYTKHIALADSLCIVAIMPLIVLTSSHAELGILMKVPSLIVGLASYPLYILHIPLLYLFGVFTTGKPSPTFMPIAWVVYLFLTFSICLRLEFYYDRPVRGYLRKYLNA